MVCAGLRAVGDGGGWWLVLGGLWLVVGGLWCVVGGLWRVVGGVWLVVCGVWYAARDVWLVMCTERSLVCAARGAYMRLVNCTERSCDTNRQLDASLYLKHTCIRMSVDGARVNELEHGSLSKATERQLNDLRTIAHET